MRRFLLCLTNELKLARTALPVHIVAILQPTLMYILMSVILVQPTFDIFVSQPANRVGVDLVEAMGEVGSPIGEAYINPIIVDTDQLQGLRQVVSVKETNEGFIAVQQYGLIDSNIVKNYRNRLTSAALQLWNKELGGKAVQLREHPTLPRDMPYTLFFGMAMLPLAAAITTSIIGGTLAAQDFEFRTILEYRLSPQSPTLLIGTRFVRLVITGLMSTLILLTVLVIINGILPASPWLVFVSVIPIGIIFGGIGLSAGMLFGKSIPAFLVGLISSFVAWLLGSAFGLAAGFSRAYEIFSRFTPNTHTVELLYPLFFRTGVGIEWQSILFLTVMSIVAVIITIQIFCVRVQNRI